MAQHELQDGRSPRPDQKNRLQWRSSLESGSESKMCLSYARMMSKDKNDDSMRCSPVSLSDNGSAQGRAFCPMNMDWKRMELNCTAFDDEYQPLPSPAHFCQKTRQCAGASKDRSLCTAAHACADVQSKKRPISQADALPATVAQRPEAWCFPMCSSRGRPERGPISLSENPRLLGNVWPQQPCSGLCPSSMSVLLQGTQPESAAPDPAEELKPSSAIRGDSEANRSAPGIIPLDLHVPTHQLKETSSFWKVSHSHRNCSVDSEVNPGRSIICHTTQRHSPPDSPAKLERNDLQPLSSSQCTTTSAYHPLTAVKNHPAWVRAEHSRPSVSELSSVLRQLLDLVERHWNGPQSLQLNPQFLTPAYDLLASLVTAHPVQLTRSRSAQRIAGVDENGENRQIMKETKPRNLNSSVLKQKNQPTQKHQQTESLKTRILTAVEDRNSLNCPTPNRKPEPAFNIFHSARQWEQCLKRQVEALQDQERHLKQLEETVGLLQDSHRSLISSNNTLMEHLNSPRSPPYTDSQK